MLHIRVVALSSVSQQAAALLRAERTTSSVVLIPGVALDGGGDMLLFDVARENANSALALLRSMGIVESGSISISEPSTVLSVEAELAEAAAPGHPDDGVVWEQIEDRAASEARPSWSFMAFLVLATLLAGIGRYLDQPILIIGAMVVGPEFAPVAAISLALARGRHRLLLPASLTLFGGFLLATAVSALVWLITYGVGAIDATQATTGKATEFIIKPDGWSFVVALLAGCAGVLSLTTAKSSALVGVFISVTTVPAVGTIGLTLAVGAWGEAGSSMRQLAINLAGLIIAGTITLAVQALAWRRLHGR